MEKVPIIKLSTVYYKYIEYRDNKVLNNVRYNSHIDFRRNKEPYTTYNSYTFKSIYILITEYVVLVIEY